MTAALILIASIALLSTVARGWYRRALAQQAATDAQALAAYSMGSRFSSPALGAPYDQSKVAQWQRKVNGQAAYRRARSRKAQAVDTPKVAQIRRRA